MRRIKGKRKSEELNYWQSYSDMMAALLLMFVLIITVTILQAKDNYEKKQAELEEQNKAIIEYRQQVEKQQEQLDQLVGVRSDIIAALKSKFVGSDLDVTIDTETGAISFDSKVLFDYDQYKLKSEGITFLNEFFPQYFEVILQPEIREYVAEVIIEGHTDQMGEYLYNLDLSQKRAFSVAEYCLGENNNMFSDKELESIRAIVTANGRAYYEPIYDSNGNVDADASRRVEVQFRLTEDEMIKQMSDILEKETNE